MKPYIEISDLELDYYRLGVLDALREHEPLTPVLAMAGEPELLIAYCEGLVAGTLLEADKLEV